MIRGNDPILKYTINDAGTNVLYLPLAPDVAHRTREVNAALYALAVACGAAFLPLERVSGWGFVQWALLIVLLAVLWILLMARSRRLYIAELAESVSRRRLSADTQPLDLLDETTAVVLVRGLSSPADAAVLHTLELMSTAPSTRWNDHLIPLLQHRSAQVRVAALDLVVTSGGEGERAAVRACLGADDVSVRAAAVTALCEMGGDEDFVDAASADPDPRIRAATAIGLDRRGGDGVAKAQAVLAPMLAGRDPSERQAAARAVGAARIDSAVAGLTRLLDDDDLGVRTTALEAAARVGAPGLAPALIRALGDVGGAADALVDAVGSEIGPLLAAVADQRTDTVTRVRILRVLERIGTQEAASGVLAHIRDPESSVRGSAQLALARMRSADPGLSVVDREVSDALDAELQQCFEFLVVRADLGTDGEGCSTRRSAAGSPPPSAAL